MAQPSFALLSLLYVMACFRSRESVCACRFPAFAQNRYGDQWHTQETWGGLATDEDVYVTVSVLNDTIQAVPRYGASPPFRPRPYNRTCVEASAGGAYLVLHQDETDAFHLCLRFVQRGPFAFQVEESEEVTLTTDCDNVTFSMDPWPYLHTDMIFDGTTVACPFQGGFNAAYYNGKSDRLICDTKDFPNRFEIDCTKNEGILLSFRGCIHTTFQPMLLLGLISSEKSECRVTWTKGPYTFILFGRLGTTNKWILRYNTGDELKDEFDIYIFSDIVADTNEMPVLAQRFLRARLTRRIFNSLCDDLKGNCPVVEHKKDCGANLQKWCLKSCKRCGNTSKKTYCKFSRKFRGEWLSVQSKGVYNVNVDHAYFNFSQYEDLRCAKIGKYTTQSKHYSSSIYQNGCQPRFTCLSIQKKGSVLKYKLGNPVTWPNKERVCASDKFQSDFTSAYFKYRGDQYRHLVLANKVKKSNCDLPGSLTFRYNVSGSLRCLATLSYDTINPVRTQMILHYTYCTDTNNSQADPPPNERYTCTGSFYVDAYSSYNYRFIIALRDKDPRKAFCWIIHQRGHKQDQDLLKVPAGECQTTDEGYFVDTEKKWPRYSVLNVGIIDNSQFPNKSKVHKSTKRGRAKPTVAYKLSNHTDKNTNSVATDITGVHVILRLLCGIVFCISVSLI